MSHPELAAEQAYVDHAYACLDKMRTTLDRTQNAMATEFAAIAMEAWAKRRIRTFQDAERGLCFGRLTLDGGLRPLYVGRRWVHDDEHESLVVNWQAPAARPFYTATPETRTAFSSAGVFAPRGGASSTSRTSRSTAPESRVRPSPTSCSRSSSGGARAACGTSSPRSSPTSTA